ncbi:prealbumin-like fold domain-containing protein, partial [Paenibacillus sp. FJAT-27812]|uniref:prealbumin-like fold domain-containing protein n=1 Tax=Paenibacillus sp. FJAT-27812 TaxID=1684143 RepID=UPI0018D1A0D7
MRYWKKQFTMSLVIILILSLALGSFVMAEGQNGGGQSSGGGATTPVPNTENSCQNYSNDRNNVIASHSNIVVNGDGTATATFKTKIDCVRVSFSSYVAPADWAPGPGDLTIPYNKQTYFDGQSIAFDKAGTYTITITIPKCLPYQLDIYSGDLLKVLGTGAHGDKILAWNLKLQNSCTGNIVINKLLNNVEGAPHAGITFELWKNNQLFKSGVTGSDGTLSFNNLPIGNYVLKELTLDGFTTDLAVNEQIAVTTDSTQLKVVINSPKLKIESACSVNPNETRSWKVTNESNIDVPYSWKIEGSNQTGAGSIPSKATVSFSTNTVADSNPIANTLTVYWSTSKQLLLASTGELCVTPTPSTTPTPTPTPTATPTASPTPDVTPTLPPT